MSRAGEFYGSVESHYGAPKERDERSDLRPEIKGDTIHDYIVPIDPMEALHCEGCQ
jgi:hypothetical protein